MDVDGRTIDREPDDELELLLRDVERLVGGLDAISDVIVTLDIQREVGRDE